MTGDMRIFVNGNPGMSEHFISVANKIGCHVCGICECCEEAMDFINDAAPDLVVIDISQNERKNRIRLARHINKEVMVPFIYIIEYLDLQIIEDLIHSHPSAFIMKSFLEEEVKCAVGIAAGKK